MDMSLSVICEENMKVIKIEEFSKTKIKIIFESMEEIILYKADLRRYHIEEGQDLQIEQVNVLMRELLPRRAKMRCMKLLQSKDYTEGEIRAKLVNDGYPQSVIDEAVQYLYGYKYLDDERYVKLYYQSRSMRKSKKQIIIDLQQKGISKDTIIGVLEQDFDIDTEGGDKYCICKWLFKKKYDDDNFTYEEKEKVKTSLYRKGFQINDINQCMHNFSWKKCK